MQMFRFEEPQKHKRVEQAHQKEVKPKKKLVLCEEDTLQLQLQDLQLSMKPLVALLDINRVRDLSLELHRLGRELRHIDLAIRDASVRADDYRDKANEIIKEGRQTLIALLDELRKQGFLEHLESALRDSTRIHGAYDPSVLDSAENQLLSYFGIGPDEHVALKEIFTAYREDRATSLANILGDAVSRLGNYSSDVPEDTEDRQNRLRVVVHGGFEIFAGLGVAGMNVITFWATAGLLLSAQSALQSWATGSAMALRGTRLLREGEKK